MGFAQSWEFAKTGAESSSSVGYSRFHFLFHPLEVRNSPPVAVASGQADFVALTATLQRRYAYARVSPPAPFSRSIQFFAFARKLPLANFAQPPHPSTPRVFDANGDDVVEDVYSLFDSSSGGTAVTIRSGQLGSVSSTNYPAWPSIMPTPADPYFTTQCYSGYEVTEGKAIVDYSGGMEFID